MKSATRVQPASARTRDEWRALYFELIDQAAAVLEVDVAIGEDQRHLPETTLHFLRSQDLLRLKLPAELGGAEADNALQFEVYEQLAYHNAAASWCCFIYTDLIALMSSMLTDEGLQQLFAQGLPLVCGGGGRLIGDLHPTAGGYRISGRWAYGSGITGSDWTAVMAMDKANADTPEIMMCVLPTSAVRNLDNWSVLGLQGTGSSDFTVDDVFVPSSLAFRLGQKPVRGGPQFLLGTAGLIGHTVPAVAIGVARRALDDLIALAKNKQRGYAKRTTIGDRPAFQAFLGKADLRLKAASALMIENGWRLSETAAKGIDTATVEAEVRAAGSYATEQAVEIVSEIIRWVGGEAVQKGNGFERALRDVHVASTHYCINNTSLESHGQHLLGFEDIEAEA